MALTRAADTAARGVNLEEFVGKLEGVRRHGSQYQARCPAHEDRVASLSIREGLSQPIVLRCFAGCEVADVLGALGLQMADLCVSRNGTGPAGFVVDEYEYVDEQRELLYVVERLAPKAFLRKRPVGIGEWEYRTAGVRRVPYRLPEILAAVSEHRWVFVVEGEKDVHAAERLGFVATTWAGGADSWQPDLFACLAGASVVLIADEDKAGEKLLPRQIEDLERIGASVRHISLGAKDLSEWVRAGHDSEDLRALVRASAPALVGISGGDVAMAAVKETEFVVPSLLPVGLVQLAGAPKTGKSFLAANLALGVNHGGLALGIPVGEPRAVLCLFLEDTLGRAKHRLTTMACGEPLRSTIRIVTTEHAMPPMKEGGIELLDRTLNAMGDVGLVVVDTFALFAGEEYKGSVYRGEYREWSELKQVADRHGCCLLALTHDTKGAQDAPEWTSRVSGTRGTTGAADAVMLLNRRRGTNNATLKVTGREMEESEHALFFDAQAYTWRNMGSSDQYRHESLAMKIAELVTDGEWGPGEIADELDEDRRDVANEMARMARRGQLSRVGRGRYRQP